MAKKQTNPYDLTDDEIDFLRSGKVPDVVRGYLSRQHENIGTKITAYRKVAQAARAECEAILAARDLGVLHEELKTTEDAQAQARVLEQQNRALTAAIERKDAEIMGLRAMPARAVHALD